MLQRMIAAVFGGLFALTGAADAQTYPARPLTMIIPFAAGGPTDVLGRVMAARMGEILGQQVVVENVGGAGGMTGSKRVADAAPDGYTFVLGTVGTHAQGQTMYKKPLYNSVDQFTPVALIAEVPIILTVRKDLPVNDFKEFVAYGKANQAKMQFGSAGAGSATHLGCVLLNYVTGLDITHVPYRGTGPAMQDLQGGRIDYLCEIITTAKPQVDGGTVKALAIFDKQRSQALPNLPTARRAGHAEPRGLYVERDLPAEERPRGGRQEAQRRGAAGDAHTGGARAPAGPGRADRVGRSRDPAISRHVPQERDREMGRPDQGGGREHRLMSSWPALCRPSR